MALEWRGMRLTNKQMKSVLVTLTIFYLALDAILLFYRLLTFFVLVIFILTFVMAINITRRMASPQISPTSIV